MDKHITRTLPDLPAQLLTVFCRLLWHDRFARHGQIEQFSSRKQSQDNRDQFEPVEQKVIVKSETIDTRTVLVPDQCDKKTQQT